MCTPCDVVDSRAALSSSSLSLSTMLAEMGQGTEAAWERVPPIQRQCHVRGPLSGKSQVSNGVIREALS